VSGNRVAVVVVVVVLGAAGGVAAFSRGGDAPPKQRTPSIAAQRFGDDADLMRRLERKKLVGQR
jgi:hypothetical protein